MEIALESRVSPSSTEMTKSSNWARTIENGDIMYFAEAVSSLTLPFFHTTHQSVSELESEIRFVSRGTCEAAFESLPLKKARKKKFLIKDVKLKALCKTSKAAWKKWHDAGRPMCGPLAEEKKHSKNVFGSLWPQLELDWSELRFRKETVCTRIITLNIFKSHVLGLNAQN